MALLWRKTNLICRVFSPSSLEFSVQFWYRLQSLNSLHMFSDLPLFRTECLIHFQTRGRNALWSVSSSCEKFTLIANSRNALSPLTNTNLACILFQLGKEMRFNGKKMQSALNLFQMLLFLSYFFIPPNLNYTHNLAAILKLVTSVKIPSNSPFAFAFSAVVTSTQSQRASQPSSYA